MYAPRNITHNTSTHVVWNVREPRARNKQALG